MNNDKKSNESYRTQAKIGQIALMQRTNFEEAINLMGETIEDMDKKINFKTKILLSCWLKKKFFLYKP